MDPFDRLPKLRSAKPIALAAGLLLAAAASWACIPAARAAPLSAASAPLATPLVAQAQFGRAGPLARARLKRRLAPGRAGGPKRPSAGKVAAPKKVSPPSPTCGVRGRPPCKAEPKITGPATPPPPGRCTGPRCPPPGGPGVIVTPPPSGGGFGASYLAALPRIAEGARANPGPPFYTRQVLVLIDQAQPAALEDTLAQQYNLQRLNNQVLTLVDARAQLYAIPDGRTVAALVSVLGADPRVPSALIIGA